MPKRGDDAITLFAATSTQPHPQPNIEVVVNKHVWRRLLLLNKNQLIIITCSKPKLITHETETATNSLRFHVQLQLSKPNPAFTA